MTETEKYSLNILEQMNCSEILASFVFSNLSSNFTVFISEYSSITENIE